MVSIHIRITEKSISNFESNPIGYQTKQTVEEPKTARSLLDSRVKDSTNSSLYGKTGSDGAHQHTFLRSNIENSTFHHPPGADGPPFSPERETYGMLLFIQLLHSCLLRRGKGATCYRYSQALTYSILLSSIRQQRSSRDEWVLPDSKMAPELYKIVRPGAIFLFGIS